MELRATEGVTNVTTAANNSATEYVLTFQAAEAARFGVTLQQVSSLVRSAVFGTEATSITSLNDETAVIVKQQLAGEIDNQPTGSNIASIEAVERLQLSNARGEVISVGQVVDVSLRESRSVINHIDGDRVFSVSADVAEGADARGIQSNFLSEFSPDVPASISVSSGGGETEESNQAFAEMFAALVVGIGLWSEY